MTADRDQMNRALKAIVVPKIRALGFVGRLPHFRRKRGSEHQMLMLMFNRYGGSFYLEAGHLSEAEFHKLQESWSAAGKILAESSLTVGDSKRRARLGSTQVSPNVDHWFVFGPDNQSDATYPHPSAHYDAIATKVAHSVETQVERFFESAP